MPIFGIGLHVLVAIFFAIHAVRSGRELYWLFILFMFPLLGSVVYFAVVFLPDARLQRGVRRAGAVIDRAVQPGRPVREARAAYDLTPTAANRLRLAQALLDARRRRAAGRSGRPITTPACAARSRAMPTSSWAPRAPTSPTAIRPPRWASWSACARPSPVFGPNKWAWPWPMRIRGAGRNEEAGSEYEAAATRFGSVEARARLALWALKNGQRELAEREMRELAQVRRHMNRHTRSQYQSLFSQLDSAAARG